MPDVSQEFAFVSWDGSDGRRLCPLATFGSREPQTINVRLVCADPPRADQLKLKNAAELRGSIALVVRGGCSFARKARLLQRAGAAAMLLANNTRNEPFAAFTMGESSDEFELGDSSQAEAITIPSMMMCLHDVRELFQAYPPSVKTGVLTLEILQDEESTVVAKQCIENQRELQEAEETGKGWKAIKRTTTSLMKLLEPQTALGDVTVEALKSVEIDDAARAARKSPPPLFGFVQWSTSSSTYEICFAPLADFCSVHANASFTGKVVVCDPLTADKPLKNEKQINGAIALLRRGICSFPEKLERVERAGALAAIVCNDDEEELDAAFVMSVDRIDAANATIPAVMISHNSFLRMQSVLTRTTARILCRASKAANALLALTSRSTISFRMLPMPAYDHVKDDEAVFGSLYDLHVACRDGDYTSCQQILSTIVKEDEKNTIVNASCPSSGLTALHHTCASGNDLLVDLLLQLGANPNALDLAMQTPLHTACTYSHVKCAQLLLRAEGAASHVPLELYSVDEKYGGLATRPDIGGATPMHAAALAGCAECIELLLSCNARTLDTIEPGTRKTKYAFLGVNAVDMEGSTPLHLACKSAHVECAMYLIAANGDVNVKDFRGHSPLYLSCEAVNNETKKAKAAEIVDKLIRSGAVAQIQENDEKNASRENGELLVDLVESPSLRREFEITYLRSEARNARVSTDRIDNEILAVKEYVRELESMLSRLQEQVQEHEKDRRQLQELRSQLQILQRSQSCSNVSLLPMKLGDTPLMTANREEQTSKSDEELALDAALARDLGKRCCRQEHFQLAVKYFHHSLELFPLPGVCKLLDTARKNQQSYPRDADCTIQDSPLKESLPDLQITSTKWIKIRLLQQMIDAKQTTAKVYELLNRELKKVADLAESTPEFFEACRWMDWLVSLPWEETQVGVGLQEIYARKRRAFEQLDNFEKMQHESRELQAVRKIQRVVRRRYAMRFGAALRIQTKVRAYRARKRYPYARQGPQFVSSLALNYNTVIDPGMKTKLGYRYQVKRLVRGHDWQSEKNLSIDGTIRNTFRVVQLVECSTIDGKEESNMKLLPLGVCFFVWSRWGRSMDEYSLSGPYEDYNDAERRFERALHAERAIATKPVKSSGLKMIVRSSRNNVDSVASA